ncbi:MAG TPA: ORC1-type DNA replication protein [Candidatus Nanoarchaeia archaeon]|nr:ORC1-type DNA replication protein [Candidatus Nanoarchaeia archaeon]
MKKVVELVSFFQGYLDKEPLFVNKKVLQSSYTPENLSHRDEQIKAIAGILAPSLRMDKPSNMFLYGKTGTGKTVVTKYVLSQIAAVAKEKNLNIQIIYLNCKLKRVADTEYRLFVQLARELGKEIPATGLPTDEVYKIFLKHIDSDNKLIILVLDEIDQLIKKAGDEILYNLTRINSELKNVELTVIGISNDLLFMDEVDPRVKSSLSEEELVFPPYNAIQIQDILRERSTIAFRPDIVKEGVIEKCAAYAAREHGDARRALELLRVAGELAERKNKQIITIEDIDEAEEKIERDKVLDIVHTQPKQFQLTLLSIFDVCNLSAGPMFTGDIYEVYKTFCSKVALKPLTQRRVSDIIAELDMLGIINARVISKGRYGRTREIRLGIPASTVPTIRQTLSESLGI